VACGRESKPPRAPLRAPAATRRAVPLESPPAHTSVVCDATVPDSPNSKFGSAMRMAEVTRNPTAGRTIAMRSAAAGADKLSKTARRMLILRDFSRRFR